MFMLRREGRIFGPFNAEEIRELLVSGSIATETEAAPEGTEAWGPVSRVIGLSPAFSTSTSSTNIPFAGGNFTIPTQEPIPPSDFQGSTYEEPSTSDSPYVIDRPPTGIILVSIYFALAAFIFVFFMVMALLIQHAPQLFLHRLNNNEVIKTVGGALYTLLSGLGAALGIIAMGLCAFYGYLAYCIYALRNWARITGIVLECVGILNQLQSCVFSNAIRFSPSSLWILVPFTISCTIIYYLNSAKVKRLFN